MDVVITRPFGWKGSYGVPVTGLGDIVNSDDIPKLFPSMQCKSRGSYGESGSGPVFIAKKTQGIVYPSTYMSSTPTYRPDTTIVGKLTTAGGEYDWYGQAFQAWHNGFRQICSVEVLWGENGFYEGNFHYAPIPLSPADPGDWISTWGYRGYWDPKVPKEFQSTPEDALGWIRLNIFSFTSTMSDRILFFSTTFSQAEKKYVEPNEIGLLYGEYAYWAGKADEAVQVFQLGSGTRQLHAGLFNYAYRNAVNNMPALHQNSFANIIEAVSQLRSLCNGLDLSDIKSLKSVGKASKELMSDVWLKYRYQYSTTVSDLTEAASALARLDEVAKMNGYTTTYGTARDSTGTFHCAIVTRSHQLIPEDSIHMLRSLGLAPSLANAWDMVPFSFMVDWFLQISNVLEGIEDWLYEPSLKAQYWYSYTNTYEDDTGAVIDVYFRYRAGACILPTWEYRSASRKTWWMRAGDTVSLFF